MPSSHRGSSPSVEPSHSDVEKQENDVPSKPGPAPTSEYPDGGLQAWLVVLGGFMCNFVAFGYVSSYGVFQAYYTEHLLPNESPSALAWIGSIQAFMLFFPAFFGGALFDIGWFKIPLLISCSALVLFTFLVGQCTKYWHFLLCQGIASGFAGGMMFSPIMTVLGHWWLKRRGLAYGVIALGSSFGGVSIPILVRRLIPRVGFPWTMRILGFLFLALLTILNLTMKRRLPANPGQGFKTAWDHRLFTQNLVLSLYVLAGFFAFLGFYVVIIFIDIAAVSHGVDANFSFYLVSILNGVSAVGRLSAGRISDVVGSGNTVIPSLIASAAVTYGFPFAKDRTGFILIAIFYGLASGAYIATFIVPIYGFGEMKDLGKRMGMAMTLGSFAALAGPPIAGALVKSHGYSAAGYFGGTCMIVGLALIITVRFLHLKGAVIGKF
ncbi:major facilitator superfamily domain-containing protein [Flagelloscypha sp. PMI_526]|nr:major facilitator superfamily domain-containing protein [Flagelloscypha sp. PMI_526]